jgi:predicted N-acetyltransferase YhbS
MRIREAIPEDFESIEELHLAAFAEEGHVVSGLARELMQDESANPRLVLVAVSDKDVVGCVIFSSRAARVMLFFSVTTKKTRSWCKVKFINYFYCKYNNYK